MAAARSLFLKFNEEEVLEETEFGQVLACGGEGRVYISGVFVSEEPGLLFSYNVTDLTEAMRKRLNRERLNVGRTTYAERIRSILKAAASSAVMDEIIERIRTRSRGELPDELTWIEITLMALTYLHQERKVVFVTEAELHSHPDVIDHARLDGIEVFVVISQEKAKPIELARTGGVATRTLETYVKEFNESFEYTFVDVSELDAQERTILNLASDLFGFVLVASEERQLSGLSRVTCPRRSRKLKSFRNDQHATRNCSLSAFRWASEEVVQTCVVLYGPEKAVLPADGQEFGRMLRFTRNTLSGSQAFLISMRRSRLVP